MILNNEFNIKDRVYLITDPDQKLRIITGILVRDGSILYEAACGTECKWFCDFEISTEKDVVLSTTN